MKPWTLQQDEKAKTLARVWVSGIMSDIGGVFTFKTEKEMQLFRTELYRLRSRVFKSIDKGKIEEKKVSSALMEAFRTCRIYQEDELTLRIMKIGSVFRAIDFEQVNFISDEVKGLTEVTEEEEIAARKLEENLWRIQEGINKKTGSER